MSEQTPSLEILQLQEKIDKLHKELIDKSTFINHQYREIDSLKNEVRTLGEKLEYWRNKIFTLQKANPTYEYLSFTFTLAPYLFYACSDKERQAIWQEMIHHATRELFETLIPKLK